MSPAQPFSARHKSAVTGGGAGVRAQRDQDPGARLPQQPPARRHTQPGPARLPHPQRQGGGGEGRAAQQGPGQWSEDKDYYGILWKSFIFPILHCIASICHLLSQNCTTLLGLFEVRSQYNVLCSYCIITVSFPVRCPVSREWPVPGRGPTLTSDHSPHLPPSSSIPHPCPTSPLETCQYYHHLHCHTLWQWHGELEIFFNNKIFLITLLQQTLNGILLVVTVLILTFPRV